LAKIETLSKEKRYEYTIKGNWIYVSKDKVEEIRNNISSTSTQINFSAYFSYNAPQTPSPNNSYFVQNYAW